MEYFFLPVEKKIYGECIQKNLNEIKIMNMEIATNFKVVKLG